MAKVLGVSRSGYYKWLDRKLSKREISDNLLKIQIQEIHKLSRATYGSKRIQAELKDRGMISNILELFGEQISHIFPQMRDSFIWQE